MTKSKPAEFSVGSGLAFVSIIAAISTWLASLPALQAVRISPLIVGIVFGAILGNTIRSRLPDRLSGGITFSAKKVLRLAIILYGFRITFGQIGSVGWPGLLLDLLMVTSTLILGSVVGIRFLGMDKETAIMTSAGAAICGAAAVVATEPVVKAEPHKTAIAIATVVIFGTLAMFLYPLAYRAGLIPMSEETFGVFIGASVHEVAHVVGAGEAISPLTGNTAVIVKMTRVMLLAPALMAIGWALNRHRKKESGRSPPLAIPWFAVGFVAVAGLNSLGLIASQQVDAINTIDTFLLTMAMTAIGLDTVVSQFKGVGLKPLYLALGLFFWLVIAGYTLTSLLL